MSQYNTPMLRDNALAEKNYVITGGGTGLGKSISKYLLELGANVVITSRKQDVLDQTASELSKGVNGKIIPISCDVRKHQEIDHMLEKAISELGEINGVINNAAGNFISPTERLSPKAFDTIIGIVLQGTYNCTLAFGKDWIEKKIGGTFLNIVTTYAWTGSGFVVPSACAKAGVLSLTRSLAVEWAKYGIRSNAIAPGPFPTKGAWDRLFPENLRDKFDPAKRVPLGRVGEHQELANLAAFLLSDFSSFINGEVVTIDGGEWLQSGGEFNHLNQIPSDMWDMIEQMVRKA